MDMYSRRSRFCGSQTLVRNLSGSDGQVRRLLWCRDIARDRTSEKSFLFKFF